MAGKRVGLAIASGLLTLLGTISPKGDLETIVAQDAKPVAEEKVALSTYQQFSQNFYEIGEEFYKKAKNKDKALESLGIASYFDPSNKQITDLIQKVEKDNKLKKNERESKKVEEKYTKTKNETIETLYQNGVEKAKTNKDEALEIFDLIWKLDNDSEKPLEARKEHFGWKENNAGKIIPLKLFEKIQKAKECYEKATKGTTNKTEDHLDSFIEANKIFKVKSDFIYVDSTKSLEDAQSTHKYAQGAFSYITNRLNITDHPLIYVTEKDREIVNKEKIDKLLYRVIRFDDRQEWDTYVKKFWEDTDIKSEWDRWIGLWNFWSRTNDKGEKIHRESIHCEKNDEYHLDNVIHLISNHVRYCSSNQGRQPWIEYGFDYLMTLEYLNTALYNETPENKYGDKKWVFVNSDLDKIREKTYEMVEKGEFDNLRKIVLTKDKTQFSEKEFHQAITFFEFLFDKYESQTSDILTDRRKDPYTKYFNLTQDELFEKAYNKTIDQMDKEYRQWVLENYVGYRNFKED